MQVLRVPIQGLRPTKPRRHKRGLFQVRLSIPHPLTADSSIANQQPRTLGGACCGLQQCSQGIRGLWSPWQATLGIKRWGWQQSLPHASRLSDVLTSSPVAMQLRDLNKGTFGFVQLALDTDSNTQVAIKFIERGDKVGCKALQSALKHIQRTAVWQGA